MTKRTAKEKSPIHSGLLKELITLANRLDQKGLKKEADFLDSLIKSAGELISLDEHRTPEEIEALLDRENDAILAERERDQPPSFDILCLPEENKFIKAEGAFILNASQVEFDMMNSGTIKLEDLTTDRIQAIPTFEESLLLSQI